MKLAHPAFLFGLLTTSLGLPGFPHITSLGLPGFPHITSLGLPGLPHTTSLGLPGFPQITFTGGYTQTTRELCTTSYAVRAPKSVPTHNFQSTFRPDVVVVIVQTVMRMTVTPLPTTVEETTNAIVDSTTTLLKRTDTFYSTSTELSTVVETSTSTVKITSVFSETATATTTVPFPTKSGFVPIEDSSGLTNLSEPYVGSEKPQKPLELRDKTPGNELLFDGSFDDPFDLSVAPFPAVVDCGTYVMPTWTETIAFIRGTTTTTAVPITSTVTVTNTITSISTEAPSAATTLTSTTTAFTTETTATVTTEEIPSTTTVTAYATETDNVQCRPNNIVGPRFSDGLYAKNFWALPSLSDVSLVYVNTPSAYECCLACSITEDCLGSGFKSLDKICLQIVSKLGCRPGEITLIPRISEASKRMFIFSNGQCGLFGKPEVERAII